MHTEHAEISLIGDRGENQDRVLVATGEDSLLLIVIDGMGGHADGAKAAEVASQTIAQAFSRAPKPLLDPQGFLHLAIGRAHNNLVALGSEQAMDTRPRATCAICLVQERGAYWAHIGDSRIYHVRAGRVLSRSRDHSHVEVLIQEGAITEEEAKDHPMRNFVECCLGGDPPVPDMTITAKIPLEPGDVVLACSDGLWSGLSDDDMAAIGTPGEDNLAENLKRLSLEALNVNAPYSDNTTGTAIRWLGD